MGVDVGIGDEAVVQQVQVRDGREPRDGERSAGAGVVQGGALLEGPFLAQWDALQWWHCEVVCVWVGWVGLSGWVGGWIGGWDVAYESVGE